MAPRPPGLVVAIPSRAEPALVATLQDLRRCATPRGRVETVVVVNSSRADPPAVREANLESLARAEEWRRGHESPGFRVHLRHRPDLPERHAGVGLARRIAMDEAAERLAGADEGLIVSLDADCRCDASYLRAIEDHFREWPRSPGASIYFEHPVGFESSAGPPAGGAQGATRHRGMRRYELFLRYYRRGLLHARFPYAHHTLGSCLAVRASAYRRVGGMNRRRAGEDFYFVQKLIALGGYTEINRTRVVPAARVSRRAPFGTGAALARWMEDPDPRWPVPPPELFADLAFFVERVPELARADPESPGLLRGWPPALARYLREQGFARRLHEVRRNSASPRTFARRLFQWFNAFRAMCFFRRAAAPAARVPLAEGAARLLRWSGRSPGDPGVSGLLRIYRELDRGGGPDPLAFGPPPGFPPPGARAGGRARVPGGPPGAPCRSWSSAGRR